MLCSSREVLCSFRDWHVMRWGRLKTGKIGPCLKVPGAQSAMSISYHLGSLGSYFAGLLHDPLEVSEMDTHGNKKSIRQ